VCRELGKIANFALISTISPMTPIRSEPIPLKYLKQHAPKREAAGKFFLLLLVLLGYFGYCVWKFGVSDGGTVAALTWSFFVLCTPLADGGFLVDFPVRLLFRVRMWMSEIMVWTIAISLNLWAFWAHPEAYQRTELTSLFFKILSSPWPYWLIVLVAAAGTFLSIKFGDELMDVVHHRDRDFHHRHHALFHLLLLGGLVALIFVGYGHLLAQLGVENIF